MVDPGVGTDRRPIAVLTGRGDIAFLDGGRIIEEGKPADLLSHPREPRTRQFLQRVIAAGRL